MCEFPDNSFVQLLGGLFLLVLGFVGQWFFSRTKPPASADPDFAAELSRANKIYHDAFIGVIGFALCDLMHFACAARHAGIQW